MRLSLLLIQSGSMATEVDIYTTLATSASIFLGLLTALIVNQLVNDRAKKSRIHERLRGLISELKNQNKQLEDLDQYLIETGEELGEDLHKRGINAQIDAFFRGSLAIDREIPLSEFNWSRLQEEYKMYTNEELSHWEIFELADRANEAKKIVEERNLRQANTFSKRVRVGLTILKRRIRKTTLMDIILGPEKINESEPDISAAFREVMRETNEESVLSERDAEWHRVNSKIESLNAEIDERWQDYQSINTENRLNTLFVIAISTLLSVILPVVGMVLNVTGLTLSVPHSLNHLDLTLIGIFWAVGLVIVFVHIYRIIQEEQNDKEPDIERPDITAKKHPLSEERAKSRLRERENMTDDSETTRYVNKSLISEEEHSPSSEDQ